MWKNLCKYLNRVRGQWMWVSTSVWSGLNFTVLSIFPPLSIYLCRYKTETKMTDSPYTLKGREVNKIMHGNISLDQRSLLGLN